MILVLTDCILKVKFHVERNVRFSDKQETDRLKMRH